VEAVSKPLSRSSRWVRFVLPPLLALLYAGVLLNYVGQLAHPGRLTVGTSRHDAAGLLLFPLGIWLLYWWFDNRFATAYDHSWLYLYKKAGTERVPLGRVISVCRLLDKNAGRHYWRISYHDIQGQEQDIRVLPVVNAELVPGIDEFIAAVRYHNPAAVVQ
jgi:hypothetical protein